MMKQTKTLLVALAATLAAAACGKKPQPAAAPAPVAVAQTAGSDDAARREAEERARREREAEEARRRAELARAREALANVVYFDYDSFAIRSDARAALEAKVPVLQSNPSVQLRISGHTDESGSEEYNVALGMRRATAVKEFLGGFGIDAGRFEINSFGEAQPASSGTGDAAYAQNRRAEFEVAGGVVGNN